MRNRIVAAALITATSLTAAAPAHAQPGVDVAAELAAMRAKIESLEAEVKALKEAKKPEAPSWKGAPHFTHKAGWSFKPRGLVQFDAAFVGRPDGFVDRSLGFGNEARRLRLGAEGTIPGGFGYKIEADFADNNVEITDAFLSYQAAEGVSLIIGQHKNFNALEEMTSSRFTLFMERAAFTDAFNFERRVGLSGTYAAGDIIASAGVFTDNITDLANDENNAIGADARLVFAPKLGETQLHVGGSGHWRDNNDLEATGVTTRYRQRPFVHTTDVRFVATPALRVDKESSYGLEAAAIHGPFHAAAEVHWLNADVPGGAGPTFFGGYAEVGYFLTGETRGYKSGAFDRTKVLKPVGGGGIGAFQVNLRYDHLDLNDDGVIGGTQKGYEASLIWIPQDHVRLLLNYGHLQFDDAAVAAADGDRDYGIDVFGARAQVDF
jgi:phosphate-selective porin OprO and OprP